MDFVRSIFDNISHLSMSTSTPQKGFAVLFCISVLFVGFVLYIVFVLYFLTIKSKI